jgi:ABC-2 type transport system permease protein
MSAPPNAVPASPFESPVVPPMPTAETRPFYWSVKRELWENRSIYIAPLAAASVYLVGFFISLAGAPHKMRTMPALDPTTPNIAVIMPYSHAAMLLIGIGLIVAVFYCLDALHGERRDRSILFWKSLPVSDLTTVLSKASIPLVVLPLVLFATAVALQLIMLLISSVVLMLSGAGAATQWDQLPLFQMELLLLYTLAVVSLWYAPIYGWLLLVSGWARRATFLWVVLPPVVIGVFEKIAFRTTYLGSLMKDLFTGFAANAFAFRTPGGAPVDAHFIPLAQLTPGKFLSSPGLWIGLIFAAIFLTAAVRLRRYREPI